MRSLVPEHCDSIPKGAGPAGQPSHISHRRCACPAPPPSNGTVEGGGTMVKKDAASKRLAKEIARAKAAARFKTKVRELTRRTPLFPPEELPVLLQLEGPGPALDPILVHRPFAPHSSASPDRVTQSRERRQSRPEVRIRFAAGIIYENSAQLPTGPRKPFPTARGAATASRISSSTTFTIGVRRFCELCCPREITPNCARSPSAEMTIHHF